MKLNILCLTVVKLKAKQPVSDFVFHTCIVDL